MLDSPPFEPFLALAPADVALAPPAAPAEAVRIIFPPMAEEITLSGIW